MDYHALKQESLNKQTTEPAESPRFRLMRVSSPLSRLCEKIESGIQPDLIPELFTDATLHDLAAEVLTHKVFLEEKNFVKTRHAVFLITDAFLEKRNHERAMHVHFVQTSDRLSAEMRRIKDEIQEITSEMNLVNAMRTAEQTIIQNLKDQSAIAQTTKPIQGRKIPSSLKTSHALRAQLYNQLKSETAIFVDALEMRIKLCSEQIQSRQEMHHKLIVDHQTAVQLADESMIAIATWDEGLIKMGLDFRGSVSPALMTELIEEHLEMEKSFHLELTFKDDTQKDEFEKIKNAIEYIKKKTGRWGLVDRY